MPVNFEQSTVYNHGRSQTVEGAFQQYGAWSKLHTFNFDSLVDEASIIVNATGDWDAIDAIDVRPDALPGDVELRYTVDGTGHGAVLRYIDSDNYLLAGVDSDSFAVVYRIESGNRSLLYKRPVDCPTVGNVTFSFRQMRFSDDERDVWNTISMWMNEKLIFTWQGYVGEVVTDALQAGVAAYNSSRTFTNVRVPQLTQYTEWSSLDPGENPLGGLERAVEGRYVKYFVRWNGELRVWRTRAAGVGENDYTFSDDNLSVRRGTIDHRQSFSIVRMLGAYAEATFVDRDLLETVGHRFVEVSNPYLMNEAECYFEASEQVRRFKEQAQSEVVVTPVKVLLEPEDNVTTPAGKRIVTQITMKVTPASYIEADMQLRRDAYE